MTPVRVFTLEKQKDFFCPLRFRTYDAGSVSQETVRVLLYG